VFAEAASVLLEEDEEQPSRLRHPLEHREHMLVRGRHRDRTVGGRVADTPSSSPKVGSGRFQYMSQFCSVRGRPHEDGIGGVYSIGNRKVGPKRDA
jgi:hypothetical protein